MGSFENYEIGGDTTPPTISSVSPENGATDVPIDTVVTATFSEPMDNSTITTESFTLAGRAVLGNVTYDSDTYTATFTPDADLEYNHEYTAMLTIAITDVAGNPLAADYSWSFTTPANILSVPYYYQGVTKWCIPTSMSMIFKYYGQNIHSWDIARDWRWDRDVELAPRWSPLFTTVKVYFDNRGLTTDWFFVADPSQHVGFLTIRHWIDEGKPVLLAMNGIRHAVVVVGYSVADGSERVYIHDPSGSLVSEKLGLGSQPYIAVEADWSDVAEYAGWLSYAIAVGGTPSGIKGSLDVQDYGFYFYHAERPGLRRVYSWLYGQDRGLVWDNSPLYPLALDEKDQFKFEGFIANHTESAHEYCLEVEFETQLSRFESYSSSFLLYVPVKPRSYNVGDMMNPVNLRDLLDYYGEYTVTLSLSDETGVALYDEVVFPAIQYFSPSAVSKTTATGTGTVTLDTTVGDTITGLTVIAEATLPTAGKPNITFPHGLFSFNVSGIAAGTTVTVYITLPSAVPAGTQYWKCQNGAWVNVTSLLGDNDGDNVLTLTLTDGGLGDSDGSANGTIADPGGPAIPPTPAPTPGGVVFLPAISNLTITPAEGAIAGVQMGEIVTITAEVTNKGDAPGSYTVTLKINGVVEEKKTVTLAAHEKKTVTFTVIKEEAGTYKMEVNGLKGEFIVSEPLPPASATFEVINLSIFPVKVKVGETVTINVLVAETSGISGSYDATLKINGTVVEKQEVAFGPQQSQTVTFTIANQEAGSYKVEVNGLVGEFTVEEPSPEALSPPPPTPPAESPINWAMLWYIVGGVVMVGLIIFFLARRRAY
ncbi:MAG: Ig-like domain-containing protein [Dehalococcoidia bacterium]|nr:Ig-like domain-containing protein [Dehalococcoidia bacterium]